MVLPLPADQSGGRQSSWLLLLLPAKLPQSGGQLLLPALLPSGRGQLPLPPPPANQCRAQKSSCLPLLLHVGFSGSRQGHMHDLQLPTMSGSGTCSGLSSSSLSRGKGSSRSKGSSWVSILTRLRSGKLLWWTFGAMQRRQRALGIL